MRARFTTFSSLAVLLSLSLGGCGGARPAVESAEASAPPLLAALPESGVVIARLDLAALRGSVHADRVVGWYRDLLPAVPGLEPDAPDVRKAEELLASTEEVVCALYLKGTAEGGADPLESAGGEGAVAVLRGDVQIDWLAAWAESSGIALERRFESGRAMLVSPELVIADLGARLVGVAIGPPGGPRVRMEALRRRIEAGEREMADADLAALAARAGLESASLGAVARVPERLASELAEEVEGTFAPVDVKSVRGAALRVALDRDLTVETIVRTTGEERARGLARDLDAEMTRNARNGFVLLLGIDLWIERTETRAEGDEVRSTMRLSEDDLRMWFFHVERLAYAAKAFFVDGSGGLLGGLLDLGGASADEGAIEETLPEERPESPRDLER